MFGYFSSYGITFYILNILKVKIQKKKIEIISVVCRGLKLGLSHQGKNRLRMFENGVLRRIFGPKRGEVEGGWRRLHNEELHNFYASSDIIRVIKSKRQSRHVACNAEMTNACVILIGNQKELYQSGDLRADAMIILE
jgi:hypothetical protein